MSENEFVVGIDLSGSLEPMGNSMVELANALERRGVRVVRFESRRSRRRTSGVRSFGVVLRPWWRRNRGPSLDRVLPPVDLFHVAGALVPPTTSPLLVSVDDLRPLRDDDNGAGRVLQLRRAVQRGARLVATSYAARREIVGALEVQPSDIWVAYPSMTLADGPVGGRDVLVSVTGHAELFLSLAPSLVALAAKHGARIVVLASDAARQRIRGASLDVTLLARSRAAEALRSARCLVLLSDGARFPSLAIAAFASSVPVVATSTDVHRELLEGAADLCEATDLESLRTAIEKVLVEPSHRSLLCSAGLTRSRDFAPDVAAATYLKLYRDAIGESAPS